MAGFEGLSRRTFLSGLAATTATVALTDVSRASALIRDAPCACDDPDGWALRAAARWNGDLVGVVSLTGGVALHRLTVAPDSRIEMGQRIFLDSPAAFMPNCLSVGPEGLVLLGEQRTQDGLVGAAPGFKQAFDANPELGDPWAAVAWERLEPRYRTRATAIAVDGRRTSVIEVPDESERVFGSVVAATRAADGSTWAVVGRTGASQEGGFPGEFELLRLVGLSVVERFKTPIAGLGCQPGPIRVFALNNQPLIVASGNTGKTEAFAPGLPMKTLSFPAATVTQFDALGVEIANAAGESGVRLTFEGRGMRTTQVDTRASRAVESYAIEGDSPHKILGSEVTGYALDSVPSGSTSKEELSGV